MDYACGPFYVNAIVRCRFVLHYSLIWLSIIYDSVAVVIAFFFCYSPFHAQRVLASIMTRFQIKSKTYYRYHVVLTHISGITYYLSATINPILYQVMSRKFRIAFKDTFGRWLPCFRRNLPDITYSNIVGGVSSYKLSRTGSFYSNGSFRRSSVNFEPSLYTPSVMRKSNTAEHLPFGGSGDGGDRCGGGDSLSVNMNTKPDQSNMGNMSLSISEQKINGHQTSSNLNLHTNHPIIQQQKTRPEPNIKTNTFLDVPSFKF